MSAIELAKRILDEGYNKFVGKGLILEIKTMRPIMPHYAPFGGYYEKWENCLTIKPIVKPIGREASLLDYARPDIAGGAGTTERVASLAAFYNAIDDTLDDLDLPSPYAITLEQIAERLTVAELERQARILESNQTAKLANSQSRRFGNAEMAE